MKYKVGDRVWIKSQRYIGEITAIHDNLYLDVDNVFMCITDLHDTAQTMFEALGYRKQIIMAEEREDGVSYVGEQYEIEFDYNFEGYSIYTENNFIPHIKKDLHLAIHQQLIESGEI